jgi:dTDP-4-amino-4,6-dideoxygalactose transaminase
VPFVDLGPSSEAVRQRVLERVADTIERGDFLNGAAVADFERQFAAYCGVEHCVGVSSGLDALRIALQGAALEPGAGVIVPAHTFAATFEAVVQAGGVPVVVDITETDYNIDPSQTRAAARRTGATHILPVHLYGQLADMKGLSDLAGELRIQLVEDACQAHGARRDGIGPGQASRVTAFSFYPAKNLGAMGDAGALVTDDEELASHARALRVHGERQKYVHEHVGYTARLDTIQAAVLLEKLPFLDRWNAQRRWAASFYNDALSDVEGLALPPVAEGSDPVWHLFVIRTRDPQALAAFLSGREIQTARHYPEPPHLASAYRGLGHAPGDFPVAEALARECISLPIYPGITEEQLEQVCDAVRTFFE